MAEIREPLNVTTAIPVPATPAKALFDRVCVGLFALLGGIVIVRLAPLLGSTERWPATLGGLLVGYLLADLMAGAVHWLADRYFRPTTPLLGPMLIAPFREHHDDALAITQHDFFEISGNNAMVTIPALVILAALPQPVGPVTYFVSVGVLSLSFSVFWTNQFHCWAHAPSLPPLVRWLHASGLILTPERHARHHRGGHDHAYCVTSGWFNPLLDQIEFFERLERLIAALRPNAPR